MNHNRMNQTQNQVSNGKRIAPQRKVEGPFRLVYRILRGAFITFSNAKGAEASASLAYYTLFSLFPLLLVLVGFGSYLYDQATIEAELLKFMPRFFPVSQDFILANIQQVFDVRGTVSIISLLGLVWSSTAVFSVLIRNVNSAWPAAAPHTFIKMRLASLGIVAALAFALIFSSFSVTFKNLIISLGIPLDDKSWGVLFSSTFFTQIVPAFLRVAIFFGLYYFVPQIHVKKLPALSGAVITGLVWQIVTIVLSSYLKLSMPRYEIVYGSLAKIIALLAWIYFSGWIILFGAHLTSSIDRHTS
ncbi:MAG: YihY/virulence factor BrkB family protein [Anaerolineaceae bacterium]|nr:YihY/virulence factor BrkB family protein [Anaerolineaceae bacterium]